MEKHPRTVESTRAGDHEVSLMGRRADLTNISANAAGSISHIATAAISSSEIAVPAITLAAGDLAPALAQKIARQHLELEASAVQKAFAIGEDIENLCDLLRQMPKAGDRPRNGIAWLGETYGVPQSTAYMYRNVYRTLREKRWLVGSISIEGTRLLGSKFGRDFLERIPATKPPEWGAEDTKGLLEAIRAGRTSSRKHNELANDDMTDLPRDDTSSRRAGEVETPQPDNGQDALGRLVDFLAERCGDKLGRVVQRFKSIDMNELVRRLEERVGQAAQDRPDDRAGME